ncbi:glucose inhibited division protein A [Dorcoceras hygrometricum]|uniref:Glucose inhibited division protein A n=1 Tax=Dorcoceras hygrometricum TaxID=472368 RepID=A0A2Z7B4B8_9LAMI|nr:glucose inhibited division protein A [Dorcoceras hygrometricum]
MGPGPTDEHSVHPYHRDFIITPIADQIGPIDSVSKTEYYDLKNHFSEPQRKMTVLPLNSGKSQFDPCCLLGSRTPQNPLLMLTLSSVSVRESRIQYLCDPQWFRDTASRGPTTIVAPESQFRTCPSDHGKIV